MLRVSSVGKRTPAHGLLVELVLRPIGTISLPPTNLIKAIVNTSQPSNIGTMPAELDELTFRRLRLAAHRETHQRRRRSDASSTKCSPSIVGDLQRANCSVVGCSWMNTQHGVLSCLDAAMVTEEPVPHNDTKCLLLAKHCTFRIELSLTAPFVDSTDVRGAARIVSLWQDNASLVLRGSCGEPGLRAALQYAPRLTFLEADDTGVTSLHDDTLANASALRRLSLR